MTLARPALHSTRTYRLQLAVDEVCSLEHHVLTTEQKVQFTKLRIEYTYARKALYLCDH